VEPFSHLAGQFLFGGFYLAKWIGAVIQMDIEANQATVAGTSAAIGAKTGTDANSLPLLASNKHRCCWLPILCATRNLRSSRCLCQWQYKPKQSVELLTLTRFAKTSALQVRRLPGWVEVIGTHNPLRGQSEPLLPARESRSSLWHSLP
jgi:hypothetical protein